MNGTTTIPTVKHAVAEFYGLQPADLDGRKLVRRYTWPRQVAMTLARELTHRSMPAIGEAFGGRDHSTVYLALNAVYGRSAQDKEIARDVDKLRQALKFERESWLDRFKAERQACDAVATFLRSLEHG